MDTPTPNNALRPRQPPPPVAFEGQPQAQPGAPAPLAYQQPGTPHPGPHQPPTDNQPPKKNRSWMLPVGIVAVLAVIVGVWGFLEYRSMIEPANKANEMLALLEQGEVDDAMEFIDADCVTDDEIDIFAAFFEANRVTSHNLDETKTNSEGFAAVSGSVTIDGIGEIPVQFNMSNDDGWQVCGLFFDDL